MKRAMLLGILWTLSFWSPLAAAAEGTRKFKDGSWDLGAAGSYFVTNANYTNSGSQTSLLGGDSYTLLDLDFTGRGVIGAFALDAGLKVGNAESKGTTATRANSSISSASVGLEYGTAFGAIEVIPSLSLSIPVEKVSIDQDSVMNNEGVLATTAFLDVQTPFEGFTLISGAGYTMRGEGRSQLIPWHLGVEIDGDAKAFGLLLHGYQSFQDDSDTGTTNEANRQVTSIRVNAGSCTFYCLNPSIVETRGFARFDVNRRWTLELAGEFSVTGANSAVGFSLGGGIVYHFDAAPVRRKKRSPRDGLAVDPYSDLFQEDTNDGVDQKMFTPPPRPKPQPPPPPQGEPAPETTTPVPRRKAAPSTQDEDAKLKKQLNDAELTIELRSNKRRRK